MSHTRTFPDANCVGGQLPKRDKTWRAGATALRRATATLQYFPYTDLTAPPENAKNSACVLDGSAARSDVPGDPVRRRGSAPRRSRLTERDPSIRTPACGLRLTYCPAGVRRPCQASRTWW